MGEYRRPPDLLRQQPEATDVFSARLQEAMERQGVRVVRRLAAGDGVWHDFTAGTNGSRTAEAKSLIDAEAAFAGRRTPVQSRAALAAEFVGDTDLIAEVLDAARSQRDSSTRPLERAYCHAVVDQSRSTEHRLDLGDAARLLANLEFDLGLFLDLAREIRTTNAPEWLPLWRDLTKHAPAEVRVEPACLAAIAAWCAGDGASAWSALDRIPSDVELGHPVAPVVALLRESLHSAAHPRTWDRLCAEAFDSTSHVANPTEDATHLESTGLSPGTVPKAAGPAR